MLVRFHSPAHHDIIMFGNVAKELIHLMGFSGRIPSAVQAADLADVRTRLLDGLASAPPPPPADDDVEADAETQDHVPLKTRAQPLVAMIDAAIKKEAYVMWEETR
jgi:Flp pilus assembly CpaE family ATPase